MKCIRILELNQKSFVNIHGAVGENGLCVCVEVTLPHDYSLLYMYALSIYLDR